MPTFASDYIARRVAIISTGRAQGMTWERLAEEVGGGISPKGLSAWWAHHTRTEQAAAEFRERFKCPTNPRQTTAQRRCLRCQKSFDSEGPHNRLCGPCRNAI
jgi:hypothetical protein